MNNLQDIQRTLDAYRQEYMSLPGVVGVGIGWRNDVLCFVVTMTPGSTKVQAPGNMVGGYPLIVEFGEFTQL